MAFFILNLLLLQRPEAVRMAVGPFPQTLHGEDDGPGLGSGWRGRLELALVVGP